MRNPSCISPPQRRHFTAGVVWGIREIEPPLSRFALVEVLTGKNAVSM
jgi:hypothetical protein